MDIRECCFKTIPESGRRLVWEITHTCRSNCDYCFQSQKRLANSTRSLNENDLIKVCDTLPTLGITDVLITGGEIFYANDVIDIVCKKLQSLKLPFSFSTAHFFKTDFVNRLISYIPKSINISFDPAIVTRKEQYTFELKNVKHLLEITNINRINVKLTGIVHKDNCVNYENYLDDINKLCDKYSSLKSVYITNPYDVGYIKQNVKLDQKEQEKILDLTRKKGTSPKIKIVNFPLFNECLQKCPASKYVHMEPTGNMYPCHLFSNFSNSECYRMGNILNDKVDHIVRKLDLFAERIDEIVVGYKQITKECRTCAKFNECGGGCLAEIISAGNMIEPRLFCSLIPYPEDEMHEISLAQNISPIGENVNDVTAIEEKKIRKYIFNIIRKRKRDLSHSYDHVIAVINNARYIAEKERANLRIVTAASFFHDFASRRKLLYDVHSSASFNINGAITFLKSIGFNDLDLKEIQHCIDTSSYGTVKMDIHPQSLEARIVRDADLLDAIGARGIARVFAFAAVHNCETLGDVEWDIDNPPKKTMSLVGHDPSPIYHFFSKLLWVKNEISTETGKVLAEKRHESLVAFLKNYKAEMHLIEE